MNRLTLPLVILGSVAVAALLAWLALSTAASFGDRRPRPESPATRAESAAAQTLPPFKRLDVSGTAEVMLVQGTAESVAIQSPARHQDRIEAVVRGDTLYVEGGDTSRWWNHFLGGGSRNAQIVVTFKDLESIAAAGTVKLVATQIKVPDLRIAGAGGTTVRIENLQGDKLRLSGAGALKAELAGRVTEQTVTISGAGEYRGAGLVSEYATVTVAGAGRVVVHAVKTLNATISGAGSVDYIGDPKVTERVSGAGRVRRRDAAEPEKFRIAIAE